MASLSVRVGGATQLAKSFKPFFGGALRTAKRVSILDNGVLRVVNLTPAVTASISPTLASAVGPSLTQTTNAVTASPVGGLPPYSYAWALDSVSGGPTPFVNSPSSATTTFRQGPLALEDDNSAVFRVTVTDSLGQTAQATVSATFYRTNFS